MLYIDYGQGQVAILIYFFLIMVRIKPMATRDIIEQLGPSFRFALAGFTFSFCLSLTYFNETSKRICFYAVPDKHFSNFEVSGLSENLVKFNPLSNKQSPRCYFLFRLQQLLSI